MMNKQLLKITALPILLSMACGIYADDAESWRQFDQDGDSNLSMEEFSNLRIAQYTALDRNNDGHWTRREFVKRKPDMSMGRIDALRGKFNRWDKDENGVWDATEASQAIEGNFKWLDKNRNGKLGKKEFPRYW